MWGWSVVCDVAGRGDGLELDCDSGAGLRSRRWMVAAELDYGRGDGLRQLDYGRGDGLRQRK